MTQKEFASQFTNEEKCRLAEAINIFDVINNDATNEKKINIDIAIKDKEESGALASVAPLKDNEINFTSGEGVHIGFLDKLDKTTTNRIYREVYGMVTNILPFILLLLIPAYGLILQLGYSKTTPFYI